MRQIQYRGKVSAGMVYDQKSIIDLFRKVDEDTLLGVMDIKDFFPDKSYFFVLRRINEP
ncbi:DUF4334 domain-containing protein [Peribacillus simplex]|uniref:DUF4334 domain-containing protein n=1 Tax=Peribacillus simplex TaxID=1478 RepID=UPI0021A271C9|nr:DUF4334 domain-containing protein [Peribacillus simplex]